MAKKLACVILLLLCSVCLGKCVAQYRFNDNADSNVVIDSIGGFNGVFIGTDANTSAHDTTGKVGGALTFNGTDDYINTNNTFQSVFQNSFSISLWINTLQKSDDNRIFGIYNSSNGHYIEFYQPNESTAYLVITDGVNIAGVSGIPQIYYNSWHLFTFAVQNNSNTTVTCKVYIDGTLFGTQTESIDLSVLSFGTNNFLVGWCSYGSEGELTKGSLDNFTIWDEALTPAKIKRLYNDGCGTEQLGEIDPPRIRNSRARYEE